MYIGLAIAVIAFCILSYFNSSVFGGEPKVEDLNHSKNFRDGIFHNQNFTQVMRADASYLDMIKNLLRKPKDNDPNTPLPVVKTNLHELNNQEAGIIWFGHSSYLLLVDGKKILVDPVFHNASPVALFGKPYAYSHNYQIEDFPEIDIVLISHDHYDHLDYKAIKKLIPKTKHFITSLGVDAHLKHWGVSSSKITTLDWHQEFTLDGLKFTAAPARHFSGRKFKRGNTLWSSFILKTSNQQIYLGGDSGYDTHFEEIGRQYGPFDLAILECGQYGKDWPNIHMLPEEMLTAAKELNTKKLIPVHWGKFSLAFHPWTEPIERALKAAESHEIQLFTPKIGEVLNFNTDVATDKWWRSIQ
ncbi:MBL fold metallo-hydrolase [Pelobium sp.]|nr:MBL fold metallo-hydrolase [Pelobium sp.]MDA9555726.1 MBL fold metallo-hydrolase [Pelobium sp.]